MPIYLGDNLITQVSKGPSAFCVYPGNNPSNLIFPTAAPSPHVIYFAGAGGYYQKYIVIQSPTGEPLGTHFTIYYRQGTTGAFSILESDVLYSTYPLEGCETFIQGQSYQFKVVAHNCFGASSDSNTVTGAPCSGVRTHPEYL